MATATLKRKRMLLGPDSAGVSLTPKEFWEADYEEGWRYELIHGVLIVAPAAAMAERDPNDDLGYRLRWYQEHHPEGGNLDQTAPEQIIDTGLNQRRADRVIWAGLGRQPAENEVPSVVIEFLSPGKRAHLRDYEEKRDEYLAIGVNEYWLIDRFDRTVTIFSRQGKKVKKQVIPEGETYESPLLPGFVLDLAALLGLADKWPKK